MQESVTYSSSLEFYLAISLILPFVSFIVAFLISDRYAWAISFTAPLFQFISFCCALVVWIGLKDSPHIVHVPWFKLGDIAFTADIEISKISSLMLVVVTFISFLVHVYSTGYMAGYAGNRRYFSVLSFFTFSMLGIIVSNDLLVLFIFWELVGFSSYLLIGHWMEKPEAAAAAKKAFIINRIADAGFVVGLMIVWANAGTFNMSDLPLSFGASRYIESWQTIASLCIFLGVMGKSAQFPLFTWLPDAMTGPTPVSALIHAATMVAAGVYLVIRLPFFTPDAALAMNWIGAATAVIAALAALSQYDIKKILAYSTISQLGLMMTDPLGVAGFLHLLAHAFFKAGLFLAAGSIFHALHQAQHHSPNEFDVQDIRNLGGLRKRLPFTFLAFMVCGASLAGVPFTSGFLSKEGLLFLHLADSGSDNKIIASVIFLTSFITVIYTFRLIWFVFFGKEQRTQNLVVNEPPWVMRMPIALLMIASAWFAYSLNPFDVRGWLVTYIVGTLTSEIVVPYLALASTLWVSTALIVAYLMYRKRTAPSHINLFQKAFGIDWFTSLVATKVTLAAATSTDRIDRTWIDKGLHFIAYANVTIAHLVGWFDRNIIDGLVHTVAATARGIGSFTRSFQSGKIQMYIFWAALALIIFIIWNLF